MGVCVWIGDKAPIGDKEPPPPPPRALSPIRLGGVGYEAVRERGHGGHQGMHFGQEAETAEEKQPSHNLHRTRIEAAGDASKSHVQTRASPILPATIADRARPRLQAEGDPPVPQGQQRAPIARPPQDVLLPTTGLARTTQVVANSKEEGRAGRENEIEDEVAHGVLRLVRLSKRHSQVVGTVCRGPYRSDVDTSFVA